jgi:hypothetical protein
MVANEDVHTSHASSVYHYHTTVDHTEYMYPMPSFSKHIVYILGDKVLSAFPEKMGRIINQCQLYNLIVLDRISTLLAKTNRGHNSRTEKAVKSEIKLHLPFMVPHIAN